MSIQSVREMLQEEITSLPEHLAEEVLDFVLFVKSKREENEFLWQQVEEARAYRAQNPHDVKTVTAEEWDALTAQLDDEA